MSDDTTSNVPVVDVLPKEIVISKDVIADMPVELTNNLTLISRKLTAYLSYFSTASLTRLNLLHKFVSDAEARLYNVDVNKLDLKELNARYREAKKAQADIMLTCSKVAQQACETENTARVDELYNILRSLSADTLDMLKEALQEGNDES